VTTAIPVTPATTIDATTPDATSTALRIGSHVVSPPVVLAPMAGVTNPPFRQLCRRFGAGRYVSEMITARGLVEGGERTERMARFAPDESPRSIQLYGTDPAVMGEAVRRLLDEDRIDHVDLNFGCPARKVTRHGGGAAVPVRRRLYRDIVRAAVGAASGVPVTVKFRLGIDADTLTYLDAGRIAEDEGVAAVALHARTAEQLYSGEADWSAIARLKEAVTSIPVLGNGDIWVAADALRMRAETGCDGVVIGRGCLGRPWLFRDLARAFGDTAPTDGPTGAPTPPRLGEVVDVMLDHARLHLDWFGPDGVRDFRKHPAWYLRGYPVGGRIRHALSQASSLAELEDRAHTLDRTIELLPGAERQPRGHTAGPRRVTLPEGWRDEPDVPIDVSPLADAITSGG
jgi:nifR3 family TIM-barrel protein